MSKAPYIQGSSVFLAPPPPLDYTLPGLGLLAGTVAALIAAGATGKSMLALELCYQVASGLDILGLGQVPRGKALYVSAEDPLPVLQHRIYAIGQACFQPKDYPLIEDSPTCLDCTSIALDILGEPSGLYKMLKKQAQDGYRLIVLDTLISMHSGDEQSSSDMKLVIERMRTAVAGSACTILFLHHSNKAAALNGQGDLQQASRGSSVLTDNARWQANMIGMSREESKELCDPGASPEAIGTEHRGYYVRLVAPKVNFGPPAQDRWYRRGAGGVLRPVRLQPAGAGGGKVARLRHGL